jgi:hypothetical protein
MKTINKLNPFVKYLLMVLVLLVILFSLSGCGGGGSGVSATPTENTNGNTLPSGIGMNTAPAGTSTSTTIVRGAVQHLGRPPSISTTVSYNPDTFEAADLPQNSEIPVVMSIF